jgi:redox-sensitive bicupin YhaK (pirin superfamily)
LNQFPRAITRANSHDNLPDGVEHWGDTGTVIIEPRVVKLTTRTEVDVRRTIPHARLRKIGAWVFVDHFGPTPQVDGMTVASHPHTGLQTVTWLLAGAVDHRDSIGSVQNVTPGSLNLMTAGSGVAHSERSLVGPDSLHAVQLWIALPDSMRGMKPRFEHVETVPTSSFGDHVAQVFIGQLGEAHSPATVFSPLVGSEVAVGRSGSLPLNPTWEYGVLNVSGTVSANDDEVPASALWYSAPGETSLDLSGDGTAIVIGGEPFKEQIVMWWNFIGRNHAEIEQMREDWNLHTYPPFADRVGGWIPAPEMPRVTLQPR